eukprot:418094-Rhodomonas_salina.1
MSLSSRQHSLLILLSARSIGVFSSNAYPFHDTNAVGMKIVSSRMKIGDVGSRIVYAPAVCVTRSPPL